MSFFIAATLACTLAGGTLRRLQGLASQAAWSLGQVASDDGTPTPKNTPGRMNTWKIYTDHFSSMRPYFQTMSAITQASTNNATMA